MKIDGQPIHQTCAGAPVQLEGRLIDGRWLYFRARGEEVYLGLSATSLDDACLPETADVSRTAYRAGASWISSEEAAEWVERLLGDIRGGA